MNKERRKRIAEAVEQLAAAMVYLENARGLLEEVKEDEEAAFDNLPEGLQESERGEAMQEACDTLEEAVDAAQEAFDNLEDVKSSLEEL